MGGGSKTTYLGVGIEKAIDSDPEGIILDPNNDADRINNIEIPHEWARKRNDILTEAERTVLRAELGKLIWIARIARPGAIYNASATAQTSPGNKMVDLQVGDEEFSENEDKIPRKKD